MSIRFKRIGIVTAGIVAASLASQPTAQAQGTMSDVTPMDCKFLLEAYNGVLNMNLLFKTAAGFDIRQREYDELINRQNASLESRKQQTEAAIKQLDPKNKDYQRTVDFLEHSRQQHATDLHESFNSQADEIDQNFREANPELKRLWEAWQDCLKKQQAAENERINRVLHPDSKAPPKRPEAPGKTAEDVIWEILSRVRTAPNPDEELELTRKAAVDEIREAIKEIIAERHPDKKIETNKRVKRTTRTGGPKDAEGTTQAHSSDASAITIMLLGAGAGIAADSLRNRGSSGGPSPGHSGSGPTRAPSGGCAGGACPR